MKPPPGRHATESIYDEDTGKMYLMEKMLSQDPQVRCSVALLGPMA